MSEAAAREKGAAWLERMARDDRVAAPTTPPGATVREHFDAWISGALFRTYGAVNGLKPPRPGSVDGWRAGRYVYDAIGRKPVADVTEQDIDKIMASIPADRRAGTRAKVYALLHRGFDLAIVPARLRTTNPVTRYHRPAKDAPKLFAYLFPAELLALLGCAAVPLGRRVLYALACYIGLRKSSLLALCWEGANLDQRTILSRVSKTGIAQLFEIPAGIVWVLRGWHKVQGRPGSSAPIIPPAALCLRAGGRAQGNLPRSEAEALRADLRAAGVTRPELFPPEEKGSTDPRAANVEPLRFHDLRATFTTWAKRAGKGDGWISDRIGHLTPEMIQRYNRAARTLEDLRIEPFPDLTGTIPEFVEALGGSPDRGPQGNPGDTPPGLPADGTPPGPAGGNGGPREGSAVALAGAVAPRAQGCALGDLNVAKRGLDDAKTSTKQGTSRPYGTRSGSSGVTPVRVQVPSFAPPGIVEKSNDPALPVKPEGSAAGSKVGSSPPDGPPAAPALFALPADDLADASGQPPEAARSAPCAFEPLIVGSTGWPTCWPIQGVDDSEPCAGASRVASHSASRFGPRRLRKP
jgi:integrase